jgi:hypothetical protein
MEECCSLGKRHGGRDSAKNLNRVKFLIYIMVASNISHFLFLLVCAFFIDSASSKERQ